MTETGAIPHQRRTPTGMRRALSFVGRALLCLATLVGALYLGVMLTAQAIDLAVSVFASGLCSPAPGFSPLPAFECSDPLLGVVATRAAQIGAVLHFFPVLIVMTQPWEEAPVMAFLSCLPLALLAFCIVRAVFVGLSRLDARFHRARAGA